MILNYQGEKQWRGLEYSGSAFQLRLLSRALQFPETSNWRWRGKQYSVSTTLIIKGPPLYIPGVMGVGGAEVFVSEK